MTRLAAQTRPPDLLVISDDGSHDDSRAIARTFARTAAFDVVLRHGPRAGLAAHMRGLLARAPQGHVALADQDDVWMPDKLARACDMLAQVCDTPALCAARRIVTDAALTPRGLTALPRARAGFDHALRRNIAPGNTLVLNPAARDLVHAVTGPATPLPAFHDWALYQLVTGAGGTVIFDPKPALFYRQHGNNMFGAALGLRASTRRARQRLDGTYRGWLHAQCAALDGARTVLTPQAAQALDRFNAALHKA